MPRRSGISLAPFAGALLLALVALTPLTSAGALPVASQVSVAPVGSAVTPGVVNIATRGVEEVDNPFLEDPA